MSYIKNIKEINYEEAFDYYLKSNQNLMKCYEIITDNLINEEYASIRSNNDSLFIYYMIKNSVDMSEFKEVINFIYAKNEHLEHTFSRFFALNDCDLSFKAYSKQVDKDSSTISIWDHIFYAFIDIKNKKPSLKNDTVTYLTTMLQAVDNNTIAQLHGGKISSYCASFYKSLESLKPIFDVVIHNPAYEKIERYNYDSFFNSFLQQIIYACYDETKEKKDKIFKALSHSIDNFEHIYLSSIVSHNLQDPYKMKIKGDMLCFLEQTNSSKLIDMLQDVYGKKYNFIQNAKINEFKINEYITHLLLETKITFDIYLNKYDFDVNLDNIDVSKNLFYNFPLLRACILNLEKGKKINIDLATAHYLQQEIELVFKKDQPTVDATVTFIDVNILNPFVSHVLLNEKISDRNVTKIKANKI